MGIDAAGHDISAFCVDGLCGLGIFEASSGDDLRDLLVFDRNVLLLKFAVCHDYAIENDQVVFYSHVFSDFCNVVAVVQTLGILQREGNSVVPINMMLVIAVVVERQERLDSVGDAPICDPSILPLCGHTDSASDAYRRQQLFA